MNAVTNVEYAQVEAIEDFPLKPISDIVIIERKVEEVSKGGILIVGKERNWPSGRVVAVGPGRVYSSFVDASGHHQVGQFIPTTIKVGDYALFGRFTSGGEPFTLNGKHYVLAREGDIAGVCDSELDIKLDVPDMG